MEVICQKAFDNNVKILIDAEETFVQKAIDDLAIKMMLKFNMRTPIVYNTIQMYRHDRLAYFQSVIDHAKQEKYFVGMKIVRGAYMEKERERAEEHGYASPIQKDKASSDKDFNAAAE